MNMRKEAAARLAIWGGPPIVLRMEELFPTRKKKKVDYMALRSPLSRIPGMNLAAVRDLIDIGYSEVDELNGRSPEALFDEIQNLRENTPADRLWYLRMAVYYAESSDPDPKLLEAWRWQDS